MTAFVSEIYASVQGEGPYSGERQVFLRLAGCPLRCRYCDTPESLTAKGHPRLTATHVVAQILKIRGKAKTVSVTGGEPLVQAAFLEELLPLLKKKKLRIYLETAGVHPHALQRIIRWVDVVAMDMKLPTATGRPYWKEHGEFLKIGAEKIFVKIVLEKGSKPSEIKKAVSLLAKRRKPPLLVLQPVTPLSASDEPPSAEQITEAYGQAKANLPQVFVMPQQHKIWNVR